MHKQLSAEELAVIEAAHPVTPLTKQQKLTMWAELILKHPCSLAIYHNLEYWTQDMLDDPRNAPAYGCATAMTLALAHEPFKAEGIGETIGSALKFFELTRDELHEFSCDCGGHISNTRQAERISRIANGGSGGGGGGGVASITGSFVITDITPVAPRGLRRLFAR